MKRSETVLVYGVTGILVVILGIAVVFGNDPVASTLSVANAQEVLDLEGLLDPEEFEPMMEGASKLGDGLLAEDEGESLKGILVADQMADQNAGQMAEPAPAPALEVPLTIKPELTVASLFGPSRVEEVEGDVRYRVVRVVKGDVMSKLVQRWCGSKEEYWDEVLALNEQLDVNRLPIGTEVWLPYLEDAMLIESHANRGLDKIVPASVQSITGQVSAGVIPAVMSTSSRRSGSEYILQPGESLWVIAVRRVSPRRANAYIEEILELNPRITDPGRVRSGMKILLPETEN